MNSEEIPSEINNNENIETNEVSPSSQIEQSESEVAKEAIEQINEEVAAIPDASAEIGNIESSLALADPNVSAEIKKRAQS